MIRVLHIFNSLMPSGAETMWVAAKEVLEEQKVEVHVLATGQDVGPYVDSMRSSGYVIHHIPHRRTRWIDIRYCCRLYRLIRDVHFDAVQIHPEAWRLTNVIVSRIAGVKHVVCSIHNVFEKKRWRRIQRCLIVRLILACGARLVAVGASVRECERGYGYEPLLVNNWIDFRRFVKHPDGTRAEVRKELDLPDDAVVMMTVANCNEIKNHAFMFRMAQWLPGNYYIVHIGRENEKLGERALVDQLGLANRVRFLGSRSDIGRLLAACDVYVMTSKREGLGLSCVEALYCGVPAVVSDVPGLRDVVSAVSLCFSAALEEKSFADRVVQAGALSAAYLDQLRQRARCEIESTFSIKRNVEAYLALWTGR